MKEMSDQVRGILFVVVSLLILFAWGHFYKPPVPSSAVESIADFRAIEPARLAAGFRAIGSDGERFVVRRSYAIGRQ